MNALEIIVAYSGNKVTDPIGNVSVVNPTETWQECMQKTLYYLLHTNPDAQFKVSVRDKAMTGKETLAILDAINRSWDMPDFLKAFGVETFPGDRNGYPDFFVSCKTEYLTTFVYVKPI